jgi:adenylosuccinate synthase
MSRPLFDLKSRAEESFNKIYKHGEISLKMNSIQSGRENTCGIIGIQLGDEGKGIVVHKKAKSILDSKGIKKVYAIRYQGGSNAGHTVEDIAFHQVPSGVLNESAVAVMDQGMVIHPEDLITEIELTEEKIGSITQRVVLSERAIFCTDLERAEEWLYKKDSSRASGGTARGMGPAVARKMNKTGLYIYDLLSEDWEKTLTAHYDNISKIFSAMGEDIKEVLVPDFKESKSKKQAITRTVGDLQTFLARLKTVRDWLINKAVVKDTSEIYNKNFNDPSIGFLFEGAQSVGLNPYIGTVPDVTSTDTTMYGVTAGTGFFRAEDIQERWGVMKLTYMSSVGSRVMPTEIDLPADLEGAKLSKEQEWAAYVVEEAHEYGTTTRRRRDICNIDLPLLFYNCRMGNVNGIVGTHLDIAKKEVEIKVCTHYTNEKGEEVPYSPDLRYLKNAKANYISLPSWDQAEASNAKTIDELPDNAVKYLAFLQDVLNLPIIAVKNGPKGDHYIEIN